MEDGDDYRLISTVCPHQGARIELIDDTFVCPVHNWQFDLGGEEVKRQIWPDDQSSARRVRFSH